MSLDPMPADPSPAVRLIGLEKTFHAASAQEVRALQGIDLCLAQGSFVLVLGGNGSGKSTLLNVLAGTVTPDRGLIEIDGKDVTAQPTFRRAALIGRVFQDPLGGTAASMTVAENLSLAMGRGQPRGLRWATGSKRLAIFKERLALLGMGLEDRLGHPMGTLSGGQRQALTLMMATWLRPKLLLLDEHTAALDPRSAERILELTERLIREAEITTLMVTHSLNQALRLGNRLILMQEGRIREDLDPDAKSRLKAEDLMALYAPEQTGAAEP